MVERLLTYKPLEFMHEFHAVPFVAVLMLSVSSNALILDDSIEVMEGTASSVLATHPVFDGSQYLFAFSSSTYQSQGRFWQLTGELST
jgi:hypothetical protein